MIKNILNKIFSILGIISIIAGLTIPVISIKAAPTQFNNNASDFETLRIANSTRDRGTLNWGSSVSANAGEEIALLVYYHNNSSVTADNTKIRINFPSSSSYQTTHILSVNIWADNASAIFDSVALNLSSSQNLNFISGSVKWYPNQNSNTVQALPFGQNGDEIISFNGLNLGNIAGGWDTQGYITLKARVGGNSISNLASVPIVVTDLATNILTNSADLRGQVNPNGFSTTTWFEYGISSNLLNNATSIQFVIGSNASNNATSYYISNLSSNTTYYFRAVAQNSQGTTYGNILSFATAILPTVNLNPTVTTLSANSILTTSATLNSLVNPNNSFTTAWFEYGTSSNSFPYVSSNQSIGSGNATSNVSSNISNLSSNTTYYFRAVAQNSQGTTYGNILSFATAVSQTNTLAPFVTTNSATAITRTSANLNGTINPNGSSTNAWFEYGTSAGSLANSTNSQNIGGGASYVPVTIPILNLSDNTIYYFRPVAQNYAGITRGATNMFVTGAAALNITSQPANNTNNANQSAGTVVAASVQASVVEISETIENLTLPNGNEISNFSDIGHKLKYIINIKNIGSQTLSNLRISTQIPSALKYLESTPRASYDSIGNIVAWNTLRLRAGETTILFFVAEVQGGLNSTITNQAQIYIPAKNLNVYSNSASTYISKQKPISLRFTVDENEVKADDVLNYSIIIKNVNDFAVKNILLSIGLPEGVELIESDFPVSNKTDNSLIVDLGSVAANQEIVRKFSVKVGLKVKTNDILTAIIIVNYQDFVGNTQPIISASASSTVIDSINLSASIFGSLGSISLAGWVVLMGIMAFIFITSSLARAAMRRLNAKTN